MKKLLSFFLSIVFVIGSTATGSDHILDLFSLNVSAGEVPTGVIIWMNSDNLALGSTVEFEVSGYNITHGYWQVDSDVYDWQDSSGLWHSDMQRVNGADLPYNQSKTFSFQPEYPVEYSVYYRAYNENGNTKSTTITFNVVIGYTVDYYYPGTYKPISLMGETVSSRSRIVDYIPSVSAYYSDRSDSDWQFLGWSLNPNATSASYIAGDYIYVSYDVILYPVFIRKYTLTFNRNGGSGGPSTQKGYGEVTLSNEIPQKDGYSFLGWATSKVSTTAQYQPGDSFNLTTDTILYAVWKTSHTVEYKADHHCSKTEIVAEGYYTLSPPQPERGSIIPAWILLTRNGDIEGYYQKGDQIYVDRNMTLWYVSCYKNLNPAKGDVNGDGSITLKDATLTIAEANGTGDLSADERLLADINNNGTVDQNDAESILTMYLNDYYVLTYFDTYSYSGVNSQSTIPPQSQTGKGNITLSNVRPIRSGYSFKGWSTRYDKKVAQYQPGDSFILTKDTTLYAVWEEKNTSSYMCPKCKCVFADLDSFNTHIAYCQYVQCIYCELYFANNTQLNEHLKYCSKKPITTYTLTYNANGGKNPPAKQTTTDGTLTLSSKKPTRSGYTFLGWATSSSATEARFKPGAAVTIKADVTLYAVWKVNPTASAKINVKSSATVEYRSRVKITATASGLPSGYQLVICEGKNILVRGNNKSVTYDAGEMTTSKTYTVYVVNENGTTVQKSNSGDLEKDCEINVNGGFFAALIAFFKGLFGLLPTVEIKP